MLPLKVVACKGRRGQQCAFSFDMVGTPAFVVFPRQRCLFCDEGLAARLLRDSPKQLWTVLGRAQLVDSELYRRAKKRLPFELTADQLEEIARAARALSVQSLPGTPQRRVHLLVQGAFAISSALEALQRFSIALGNARMLISRLAALRSSRLPPCLQSSVCGFLLELDVRSFLVSVAQAREVATSAGDPIFWPSGTSYMTLLEDARLLGRTYEIMFCQYVSTMQRLVNVHMPRFARVASSSRLEPAGRASRMLQQALLKWRDVD